MLLAAALLRRGFPISHEFLQSFHRHWLDQVAVKAGLLGAAPVLILAPAGLRR